MFKDSKFEDSNLELNLSTPLVSEEEKGIRNVPARMNIFQCTRAGRSTMIGAPDFSRLTVGGQQRL